MPRISAFLIAVGLCVVSLSTTPLQALEFTQRWSIDGTPLGTERALEPTIAATADRVFISGSEQREDRRYQVIRVFDAATGRIVQTLENPSGEAFEGFGEAIAANARFMVTSVHRRKDAPGALLVFDAKTGTLLREITNPRAGSSQFFGQVPPVLLGDRILAAVTLTDDNASTAWVFSAETGEILLTIDEPDMPSSLISKPARSLFGRALAMNESYIAVGGIDRDGPQGVNAAGLVHVFDAATGKQMHRIKLPGATKGSGFGQTLHMTQDTLFVFGLPEAGALNWPAGTIYAFDPATAALRYSQSDPFIPTSEEAFMSGAKGSDFGIPMTTGGGRVYVGLPGWSGEIFRQGGMMVLDAETGEIVLTYLHKTGDEFASFGHVLATMPDGLVIGVEFPSGNSTALRVITFDIR
jgi:outer membrane protein assembly factor BamB